MGDTKMRIRIADAEVEINGRVGRMKALSLEGTFDANTPSVLGDLLALALPSRTEVVHLRAQVSALQRRGTELVVAERAARANLAEVAESMPEVADAAFEAGRKFERQVMRDQITREVKKATRAAARVGAKKKRQAK